MLSTSTKPWPSHTKLRTINNRPIDDSSHGTIGLDRLLSLSDCRRANDDEPEAGASETDVFDWTRAEQRRLRVLARAGGMSESFMSLVDRLLVLSSLERVVNDALVVLWLLLLVLVFRPLLLGNSEIDAVDLDSVMEASSWVLIFLASSMPRFIEDLVKIRRAGCCSWSIGTAEEDVTGVGTELEVTGWLGNCAVGSGVMIVVGICGLGMGGLLSGFNWPRRRFLSGIGFTVGGAWLGAAMTGVCTAVELFRMFGVWFRSWGVLDWLIGWGVLLFIRLM